MSIWGAFLPRLRWSTTRTGLIAAAILAALWISFNTIPIETQTWWFIDGSVAQWLLVLGAYFVLDVVIMSSGYLHPRLRRQRRQLFGHPTPYVWILSTFTAPVVEEIVYRWLVPVSVISLVTVIDRPWSLFEQWPTRPLVIGIVLSGLLFVREHWHKSPVGWLQTAAAHLLLGWSTIHFGLPISILLHSSHNAVAIGILEIKKQRSLKRDPS